MCAKHRQLEDPSQLDLVITRTLLHVRLNVLLKSEYCKIGLLVRAAIKSSKVFDINQNI